MIKRTENCSHTAVNLAVLKISSINEPQGKTFDELTNQAHYQMSSDISTMCADLHHLQVPVVRQPLKL